MREKYTDVFRTDEYGAFKLMLGNRTVDRVRVEKVKNSISENGYVLCPIVVNEMMEVIDGQARYQALKELGLPVYYVVSEGARVPECIALNQYTTAWKFIDYISSYAEQGNENYIRLKKLYDRFVVSKQLSLGCVTAATESHLHGGKSIPKGNAVKRGTYVCTEEQYSRAIIACEYALNFVSELNNIGQGKEHMLKALIWNFLRGPLDKDIVLERFRKNSYKLRPVTTLEDAVSLLEEIYNYHAKIAKSYDLLGAYRKDRDFKKGVKSADSKETQKYIEQFKKKKDDFSAYGVKAVAI